MSTPTTRINDTTTPTHPNHHPEDTTNPTITRRAEHFRRHATTTNHHTNTTTPNHDDDDGEINLTAQFALIILGLGIMIAGLLYIKHITTPTDDLPYLAVMLIFLLLMMIGGAVLTRGIHTIITTARHNTH